MPGPWYFAFCGGIIQTQQTIVTNGTTHGGVLQTVSIVGDTSGQQIANLASNQGLEVGSLNFISGPQIQANTYFIYDGDDRINLSAVTTGTVKSATFLVTKSVVIGDLVVTLTQGSNIVTLGTVPDLVPGVYAIEGTGIGQIVPPPNTIDGEIIAGDNTKLMPSAFFQYSGGTTATMLNYASVSHSTTTIDTDTGQVEHVITYSVSLLPCTATTSGQVSVVITGHPALDADLVTNMPVPVLGSLTGGLRYNISGPGIQVGTTFIAPSGSTDRITLDQLATASQFGAILTITGPRVPNEAFDPALHAREDLDILNIEISQAEGDFAKLLVDAHVLDIHGGLLAPGNQLWCWLSWDQAWSAAGNTLDLVPLFNGKLIGAVNRAAGEVVQLEFRARPEDYNAQKLALVESLAQLPYYDPVWLAQNVNPDVVLESYSALFHVDRTTLTVTTSDVLQGEDGTVTLTEAEAFYDSFAMSYGTPPLDAVVFSGTVSWNQQGDGLLDVTSKIVGAFESQGSLYHGTFVPLDTGSFHVSGGGLISCLCGNGLKSDWPKPGTSIGGGWSLSGLTDSTGLPMNYIIDALRPAGGWYAPYAYNVSMGMTGPANAQAGQTVPQSNVSAFFNPVGQVNIAFPINVYKIRMVLEYKANRARTETVSGVVTADVQQVLSDPAEADRETVELTSDYVGQGIDPGGGIPIGNLALPSYFQTDRGASSLEYLILLCRAKMRFRARAVDVAFATDWPTALGITLRNSIAYNDRRLPGGTATGKVKQYTLKAGTAGMWGEFSIGCAIGRGNAITGATGVNTWVDDGYVDPGYQVVAGAQVQLVDEEIAYQSLDQFVVDDDGIDLGHMTAAKAVNEAIVTNGLEKQMRNLAPFQNTVPPTAGDPLTTMTSQLTTTVTLDMKPVDGAAFHTDFFPAITMLAMPKMIDLEIPPN